MLPLPKGAAWQAFLVLCLVLLFKDAQAEVRVVCYYTNWSVYRPGTAKFNPQNINPYLCTHLIYAFGGFTKDNTLKPFDKYQDIEQGGYAKFTGLKSYNKQLKTMLAIGGWNEASSRFSPLVANPERRHQFIRNILKFLRQNHFDGLDLDWEYPAFRDGGKPRDRDNYAQFVEELRSEFDREAQKTGRPRLLLTMAVPAGVEYIEKGYDIPKLNRYLDWFNILSYDYHSAFEPSVNHHAPLYSLEEPSEYNYDVELNIDYTVKFYLEAGAERNKLVLGIPTYGRSYTLINEESTEIGSPADGPGEQGDATREKGYLAYYEICQNIKDDSSWTVVQPNEKAMGPYAYRGNQWVGYDDEAIAAKKGQYVAENGLGGIMFWSIDNDDFRGICTGKQYPLIEAAKEALLEAVGSGANEVAAPSRPRKPTRPRSRAGSSTTRNKVTEESSASKASSSSTKTGSSSSRKSNKKRPSTNAPRTTSTTTEGSLYIGGRTTTPAPPTTPDPGADFKCEEEGFFPHPRDCKKYFWCLDSGPSNLGIVAHQFTCPAGLYFNTAADSCDFTRNVPCKTKNKDVTTTKVTPAATTTPRTTTTTTVSAPLRITAATSSYSYIQRTTSTAKPFEDDDEEEYEDEEPEVTHEKSHEEDPKVIKELIELIKRVGGIEELEKQLQLQEDGTVIMKNPKTDEVSTTPSSISQSLYAKVLTRPSALNTIRNRLGASKFTAKKQETSQSNVQDDSSRTKYTSVNRNSRPSPQNAGIDKLPEFEGFLKEKPKYVTINRPRPTKSSNEELEYDEETADEESAPELNDEAEETSEASQRKTSSAYVNISRTRPTKPTLAEEDGGKPEEDEEIVGQSGSKSKYQSINRVREVASETTDPQKQEEKANTLSPKSTYQTLTRTRSSTESVADAQSDDDFTNTQINSRIGYQSFNRSKNSTSVTSQVEDEDANEEENEASKQVRTRPTYQSFTRNRNATQTKADTADDNVEPTKQTYQSASRFRPSTSTSTTEGATDEEEVKIPTVTRSRPSGFSSQQSSKARGTTVAPAEVETENDADELQKKNRYSLFNRRQSTTISNGDGSVDTEVAPTQSSSVRSRGTTVYSSGFVEGEATLKSVGSTNRYQIYDKRSTVAPEAAALGEVQPTFGNKNEDSVPSVTVQSSESSLTRTTSSPAPQEQDTPSSVTAENAKTEQRSTETPSSSATTTFTATTQASQNHLPEQASSDLQQPTVETSTQLSFPSEQSSTSPTDAVSSSASPSETPLDSVPSTNNDTPKDSITVISTPSELGILQAKPSQDSTIDPSSTIQSGQDNTDKVTLTNYSNGIVETSADNAVQREGQVDNVELTKSNSKSESSLSNVNSNSRLSNNVDSADSVLTVTRTRTSATTQRPSSSATASRSTNRFSSRRRPTTSTTTEQPESSVNILSSPRPFSLPSRRRTRPSQARTTPSTEITPENNEVSSRTRSTAATKVSPLSSSSTFNVSNVASKQFSRTTSFNQKSTFNRSPDLVESNSTLVDNTFNVGKLTSEAVIGASFNVNTLNRTSSNSYVRPRVQQAQAKLESSILTQDQPVPQNTQETANRSRSNSWRIRSRGQFRPWHTTSPPTKSLTYLDRPYRPEYESNSPNEQDTPKPLLNFEFDGFGGQERGRASTQSPQETSSATGRQRPSAYPRQSTPSPSSRAYATTRNRPLDGTTPSADSTRGKPSIIRNDESQDSIIGQISHTTESKRVESLLSSDDEISDQDNTDVKSFQESVQLKSRFSSDDTQTDNAAAASVSTSSFTRNIPDVSNIKGITSPITLQGFTRSPTFAKSYTSKSKIPASTSDAPGSTNTLGSDGFVQQQPERRTSFGQSLTDLSGTRSASTSFSNTKVKSQSRKDFQFFNARLNQDSNANIVAPSTRKPPTRNRGHVKQTTTTKAPRLTTESLYRPHRPEYLSDLSSLLSVDLAKWTATHDENTLRKMVLRRRPMIKPTLDYEPNEEDYAEYGGEDNIGSFSSLSRTMALKNGEDIAFSDKSQHIKAPMEEEVTYSRDADDKNFKYVLREMNRKGDEGRIDNKLERNGSIHASSGSSKSERLATKAATERRNLNSNNKDNRKTSTTITVERATSFETLKASISKDEKNKLQRANKHADNNLQKSEGSIDPVVFSAARSNQFNLHQTRTESTAPSVKSDHVSQIPTENESQNSKSKLHSFSRGTTLEGNLVNPKSSQVKKSESRSNEDQSIEKLNSKTEQSSGGTFKSQHTSSYSAQVPIFPADVQPPFTDNTSKEGLNHQESLVSLKEDMVTSVDADALNNSKLESERESANTAIMANSEYSSDSQKAIVDTLITPSGVEPINNANLRENLWKDSEQEEAFVRTTPQEPQTSRTVASSEVLIDSQEKPPLDSDQQNKSIYDENFQDKIMIGSVHTEENSTLLKEESRSDADTSVKTAKSQDESQQSSSSASADSSKIRFSKEGHEAYSVIEDILVEMTPPSEPILKESSLSMKPNLNNKSIETRSFEMQQNNITHEPESGVERKTKLPLIHITTNHVPSIPLSYNQELVAPIQAPALIHVAHRNDSNTSNIGNNDHHEEVALPSTIFEEAKNSYESGKPTRLKNLFQQTLQSDGKIQKSTTTHSEDQAFVTTQKYPEIPLDYIDDNYEAFIVESSSAKSVLHKQLTTSEKKNRAGSQSFRIVSIDESDNPLESRNLYSSKFVANSPLSTKPINSALNDFPVKPLSQISSTSSSASDSFDSKSPFYNRRENKHKAFDSGQRTEYQDSPIIFISPIKRSDTVGIAETTPQQSHTTIAHSLVGGFTSSKPINTRNIFSTTPRTTSVELIPSDVFNARTLTTLPVVANFIGAKAPEKEIIDKIDMPLNEHTQSVRLLVNENISNNQTLSENHDSQTITNPIINIELNLDDKNEPVTSQRMLATNTSSLILDQRQSVDSAPSGASTILANTNNVILQPTHNSATRANSSERNQDGEQLEADNLVVDSTSLESTAVLNENSQPLDTQHLRTASNSGLSYQDQGVSVYTYFFNDAIDENQPVSSLSQLLPDSSESFLKLSQSGQAISRQPSSNLVSSDTSLPRDIAYESTTDLPVSTTLLSSDSVTSIPSIMDDFEIQSESTTIGEPSNNFVTATTEATPVNTFTGPPENLSILPGLGRNSQILYSNIAEASPTDSSSLEVSVLKSLDSDEYIFNRKESSSSQEVKNIIKGLLQLKDLVVERITSLAYDATTEPTSFELTSAEQSSIEQVSGEDTSVEKDLSSLKSLKWREVSQENNGLKGRVIKSTYNEESSPGQQATEQVQADLSILDQIATTSRPIVAKVVFFEASESSSAEEPTFITETTSTEPNEFQEILTSKDFSEAGTTIEPIRQSFQLEEQDNNAQNQSESIDHSIYPVALETTTAYTNEDTPFGTLLTHEQEMTTASSIEQQTKTATTELNLNENFKENATISPITSVELSQDKSSSLGESISRFDSETPEQSTIPGNQYDQSASYDGEQVSSEETDFTLINNAAKISGTTLAPIVITSPDEVETTSQQNEFIENGEDAIPQQIRSSAEILDRTTTLLPFTYETYKESASEGSSLQETASTEALPEYNLPTTTPIYDDKGANNASEHSSSKSYATTEVNQDVGLSAATITTLTSDDFKFINDALNPNVEIPTLELQTAEPTQQSQPPTTVIEIKELDLLQTSTPMSDPSPTTSPIEELAKQAEEENAPALQGVNLIHSRDYSEQTHSSNSGGEVTGRSTSVLPDTTAYNSFATEATTKKHSRGRTRFTSKETTDRSVESGLDIPIYTRPRLTFQPPFITLSDYQTTEQPISPTTTILPMSTENPDFVGLLGRVLYQETTTFETGLSREEDHSTTTSYPDVGYHPSSADTTTEMNVEETTIAPLTYTTEISQIARHSFNSSEPMTSDSIESYHASDRIEEGVSTEASSSEDSVASTTVSTELSSAMEESNLMETSTTQQYEPMLVTEIPSEVNANNEMPNLDSYSTKPVPSMENTSPVTTQRETLEWTTQAPSTEPQLQLDIEYDTTTTSPSDEELSTVKEAEVETLDDEMTTHLPLQIDEKMSRNITSPSMHEQNLTESTEESLIPVEDKSYVSTTETTPTASSEIITTIAGSHETTTEYNSYGEEKATTLYSPYQGETRTFSPETVLTEISELTTNEPETTVLPKKEVAIDVPSENASRLKAADNLTSTSDIEASVNSEQHNHQKGSTVIVESTLTTMIPNLETTTEQGYKETSQPLENIRTTTASIELTTLNYIESQNSSQDEVLISETTPANVVANVGPIIHLTNLTESPHSTEATLIRPTISSETTLADLEVLNYFEKKYSQVSHISNRTNTKQLQKSLNEILYEPQNQSKHEAMSVAPQLPRSESTVTMTPSVSTTSTTPINLSETELTTVPTTITTYPDTTTSAAATTSSSTTTTTTTSKPTVTTETNNIETESSSQTTAEVSSTTKRGRQRVSPYSRLSTLSARRTRPYTPYVRTRQSTTATEKPSTEATEEAEQAAKPTVSSYRNRLSRYRGRSRTTTESTTSNSTPATVARSANRRVQPTRGQPNYTATVKPRVSLSTLFRQRANFRYRTSTSAPTTTTTTTEAPNYPQGLTSTTLAASTDKNFIPIEKVSEEAIIKKDPPLPTQETLEKLEISSTSEASVSVSTSGNIISEEPLTSEEPPISEETLKAADERLNKLEETTAKAASSTEPTSAVESSSTEAITPSPKTIGRSRVVFRRPVGNRSFRTTTPPPSKQQGPPDSPASSETPSFRGTLKTYDERLNKLQDTNANTISLPDRTPATESSSTETIKPPPKTRTRLAYQRRVSSRSFQITTSTTKQPEVPTRKPVTYTRKRTFIQKKKVESTVAPDAKSVEDAPQVLATTQRIEELQQPEIEVKPVTEVAITQPEEPQRFQPTSSRSRPRTPIIDNVTVSPQQAPTTESVAASPEPKEEEPIVTEDQARNDNRRNRQRGQGRRNRNRNKNKNKEKSAKLSEESALENEADPKSNRNPNKSNPRSRGDSSNRRSGRGRSKNKSKSGSKLASDVDLTEPQGPDTTQTEKRNSPRKKFQSRNSVSRSKSSQSEPILTSSEQTEEDFFRQNEQSSSEQNNNKRAGVKRFRSRSNSNEEVPIQNSSTSVESNEDSAITKLKPVSKNDEKFIEKKPGLQRRGVLRLRQKQNFRLLASKGGAIRDSYSAEASSLVLSAEVEALPTQIGTARSKQVDTASDFETQTMSSYDLDLKYAENQRTDSNKLPREDFFQDTLKNETLDVTDSSIDESSNTSTDSLIYLPSSSTSTGAYSRSATITAPFTTTAETSTLLSSSNHGLDYLSSTEYLSEQDFAQQGRRINFADELPKENVVSTPNDKIGGTEYTMRNITGIFSSEGYSTRVLRTELTEAEILAENKTISGNENRTAAFNARSRTNERIKAIRAKLPERENPAKSTTKKTGTSPPNLSPSRDLDMSGSDSYEDITDTDGSTIRNTLIFLKGPTPNPNVLNSSNATALTRRKLSTDLKNEEISAEENPSKEENSYTFTTIKSSDVTESEEVNDQEDFSEDQSYDDEDDEYDFLSRILSSMKRIFSGGENDDDHETTTKPYVTIKRMKLIPKQDEETASTIRNDDSSETVVTEKDTQGPTTKNYFEINRTTANIDRHVEKEENTTYISNEDIEDIQPGTEQLKQGKSYASIERKPSTQNTISALNSGLDTTESQKQTNSNESTEDKDIFSKKENSYSLISRSQAILNLDEALPTTDVLSDEELNASSETSSEETVDPREPLPTRQYTTITRLPPLTKSSKDSSSSQYKTISSDDVEDDKIETTSSKYVTLSRTKSSKFTSDEFETTTEATRFLEGEDVGRTSSRPHLTTTVDDARLDDPLPTRAYTTIERITSPNPKEDISKQEEAEINTISPGDFENDEIVTTSSKYVTLSRTRNPKVISDAFEDSTELSRLPEEEDLIHGKDTNRSSLSNEQNDSNDDIEEQILLPIVTSNSKEEAEMKNIVLPKRVYAATNRRKLPATTDAVETSSSSDIDDEAEIASPRSESASSTPRAPTTRRIISFRKRVNPTPITPESDEDTSDQPRRIEPTTRPAFRFPFRSRVTTSQSTQDHNETDLEASDETVEEPRSSTRRTFSGQSRNPIATATESSVSERTDTSTKRSFAIRKRVRVSSTTITDELPSSKLSVESSTKPSFRRNYSSLTRIRDTSTEAAPSFVEDDQAPEVSSTSRRPFVLPNQRFSTTKAAANIPQDTFEEDDEEEDEEEDQTQLLISTTRRTYGILNRRKLPNQPAFKNSDTLDGESRQPEHSSTTKRPYSFFDRKKTLNDNQPENNFSQEETSSTTNIQTSLPVDAQNATTIKSAEGKSPPKFNFPTRAPPNLGLRSQPSTIIPGTGAETLDLIAEAPAISSQTQIRPSEESTSSENQEFEDEKQINSPPTELDHSLRPFSTSNANSTGYPISNPEFSNPNPHTDSGTHTLTVTTNTNNLTYLSVNGPDGNALVSKQLVGVAYIDDNDGSNNTQSVVDVNVDEDNVNVDFSRPLLLNLNRRFQNFTSRRGSTSQVNSATRSTARNSSAKGTPATESPSDVLSQASGAVSSRRRVAIYRVRRPQNETNVETASGSVRRRPATAQRYTVRDNDLTPTQQTLTVTTEDSSAARRNAVRRRLVRKRPVSSTTTPHPLSNDDDQLIGTQDRNKEPKKSYSPTTRTRKTTTVSPSEVNEETYSSSTTSPVEVTPTRRFRKVIRRLKKPAANETTTVAPILKSVPQDDGRIHLQKIGERVQNATVEEDIISKVISDVKESVRSFGSENKTLDAMHLNDTDPKNTTDNLSILAQAPSEEFTGGVEEKVSDGLVAQTTASPNLPSSPKAPVQEATQRTLIVDDSNADLTSTVKGVDSNVTLLKNDTHMIDILDKETVENTTNVDNVEGSTDLPILTDSFGSDLNETTPTTERTSTTATTKSKLFASRRPYKPTKPSILAITSTESSSSTPKSYVRKYSTNFTSIKPPGEIDNPVGIIVPKVAAAPRQPASKYKPKSKNTSTRVDGADDEVEDEDEDADADEEDDEENAGQGPQKIALIKPNYVLINRTPKAETYLNENPVQGLEDTPGEESDDEPYDEEEKIRQLSRPIVNYPRPSQPLIPTQSNSPVLSLGIPGSVPVIKQPTNPIDLLHMVLLPSQQPTLSLNDAPESGAVVRLNNGFVGVLKKSESMEDESDVETTTPTTTTRRKPTHRITRPTNKPRVVNRPFVTTIHPASLQIVSSPPKPTTPAPFRPNSTRNYERKYSAPSSTESTNPDNSLLEDLNIDALNARNKKIFEQTSRKHTTMKPKTTQKDQNGVELNATIYTNDPESAINYTTQLHDTDLNGGTVDANGFNQFQEGYQEHPASPSPHTSTTSKITTLHHVFELSQEDDSTTERFDPQNYLQTVMTSDPKKLVEINRIVEVYSRQNVFKINVSNHTAQNVSSSELKLETLPRVDHIGEISRQSLVNLFDSEHARRDEYLGRSLGSKGSEILIEGRSTVSGYLSPEGPAATEFTPVRNSIPQYQTDREGKSQRQQFVPDVLSGVETSTISLEGLFELSRKSKSGRVINSPVYATSLGEVRQNENLVDQTTVSPVFATTESYKPSIGVIIESASTVRSTTPAPTATTLTAGVETETSLPSTVEARAEKLSSKSSNYLRPLVPLLRPESNEAAPLVISIANLDQVTLSKVPRDSSVATSGRVSTFVRPDGSNTFTTGEGSSTNTDSELMLQEHYRTNEPIVHTQTSYSSETHIVKKRVPRKHSKRGALRKRQSSVEREARKL